jgi:hypothetical protein
MADSSNLIEVDASGAHVTFDGEALVIDRSRMSSIGVGVRHTRIPVGAIVDIDITDPTFQYKGSVRLSVNTENGPIPFPSGQDVSCSPYGFLFWRHREEVHRLVEAVRRAIPPEPTAVVEDQRGKSVFDKMTRNAVIATFKPDKGPQYELTQTRLRHGADNEPLKGMTVDLKDGAPLQQRVTATRLLLLGPLALAAQKKSGGDSYIEFSGPGFHWASEVDLKQRDEAIRFVERVRSQIAKQQG